jgi:sugar phosphate isomerase/epimerase
MLQIRVGINLANLQVPFARGLRLAKELGAEAVEIDARGELRPETLSRTGVRQIRKQLDDLQLKVSAVDFRTRRGYEVSQDLERRVEATQMALQLAYELGASVVINQVGQIPAEPKGPAWDLLLQVLADLGQYGQKVGALLAADTGADDGERLAQLIEALPLGSLLVNFNPGNLIANGHSPRESIRRLAPHVAHLHANDGVRDLAKGRGVAVPLGSGVAEFPELLAVLEERHYRGYITVLTEPPHNSLDEITSAVRYLRAL